MSIERRPPSPHVSKKLFATVVLLTSLGCMFGGYLLGRMSHTETKHGNQLLTHNLTNLVNLLLKKARRVTPKVMHHNDPARIQAKLTSIFNCSILCGSVNKYNLADFVKNSVNFQVGQLMKSVSNATMYLDSLS